MKIVANKDSFGFQNKFWKKGEEVVVSSSEEFPEDHFDVEGAKPKPASKTHVPTAAEKKAAKEKEAADKKAEEDLQKQIEKDLEDEAAKDKK